VRDADVQTIEQEMLKFPGGGYVLITRSAIATLELYADIDTETVTKFEQALQDSGRFNLIYQSSDANVYRFNSPYSRGNRR
jgi:prephenate dehydrogenase